MTSMRILAFAGLTVIASIGAAAAQEVPVQASQFYGLYQQPIGLEGPMHYIYYPYDRAGTIGRLNLGASPFRPEGPGNHSSN
jgi:hypothetical protein